MPSYCYRRLSNQLCAQQLSHFSLYLPCHFVTIRLIWPPRPSPLLIPPSFAISFRRYKVAALPPQSWDLVTEVCVWTAVGSSPKFGGHTTLPKFTSLWASALLPPSLLCTLLYTLATLRQKCSWHDVFTCPLFTYLHTIILHVNYMSIWISLFWRLVYYGLRDKIRVLRFNKFTLSFIFYGHLYIYV